jgi:hypothetical protein
MLPPATPYSLPSRPRTRSPADFLANARVVRTTVKRIDLLGQVRFGTGTASDQAKRSRGLASALAVALDLKDDSHYGTLMVSGNQLQRLIRAAEKLVAAADTVV